MHPATRAPGPASALATEINVTPMIDVLLVLLITFMAAMPTRQKVMDVHLPPASTAPGEGTPATTLALDGGGEYSIDGSPVPHADLDRRLRAVVAARPGAVLLVQGDGKVRYQAVIDAVDVARGAGVRVVALP